MRRANVPVQLTTGPFTTVQAAEAGITRSALRSAPWRGIFRDVWIHDSIEVTRAVRLAAVRLVLGRTAFVCGHTAAWLHGIDAHNRRSDLVWVGCPTGSRLRTRRGCYTREITVDADDIELLDGIPVTTPLRTVFDCVRWLSPVEGIVVADALMHEGLVRPDELSEYRNLHRGIRHVVRVDDALGLVEPLSESPMETRLRMLLIHANLPRPAAQHVIRSPDGAFVARVDLAYIGARLAIEYDGAFHWDQRRADDRRRDAVRALDWKVIVASGADYFETPQQLVSTIRRSLATGDLDEKGALRAS